MRRIIVVILILAGSGELFAQGFYSNGAIVSISPNTILSVPDSIVNKGTLINNGEIVIYGAWINQGNYDAGNGQVTFNSGVDQVINHNAQTIEKLVISGGGKKEFLADIFVQKAITFTDGILVSKNGARIVMDQSVTITGGSDASHIQGPVERKGAGTWFYPIGNGTRFLPVSIDNVKDASAFGIVTLREITNEVLAIDNSLSGISSKRYFEFASSGSMSQATITLPNVDEGLDGDLTTGVANVATGPYGDLKDGAPIFKFYAIASVSKDHTIEVYNAVSEGNDGKNDFMTIKNIEFYPNNKVMIFNRWGDRVLDISGYDNGQNVFKGLGSNGNKLPSGTYYYTIDLGDGSKKTTGYVVVR